MKLPTIRVVFDRKKQASKTTKGLVQIEVSYNRQRKYFGTGIRLFDFQWDNSERVIKHPSSFTYNETINDYLNIISERVRAILKSDGGFSLKGLDDFDLTDKRPLLIDFIREELEKATNLAEGTIKHHNTLVEELSNWGGIISFGDVTEKSIEEWDFDLRKRGLADTSVYGYHKRLKKWLKIAVKRGFLKMSPYSTFKPVRGDSKPREYLSDAELVQMRATVINVPYVAHVRDLYLFQCFTGLAYKDLASLDFKTCIETRGNKRVVVARRAKTNTPYYIVLMKPAIDILEHYDYDLRVPALQVYNKFLVSVAGACNINKHLTTHTARHTFAIWALNHGTPIEVVSKILGHTHIATTQIYAKIVNKTIEDNFERLEQFL